MTWVNIGLESTLFSLQSILLQQLSGIGFAAQDQDIATNLRILKVAAKDAKILLVLDDLWATEQEQALNCVEPSSGSKVLITSRLRDVIPNATTVDLSLLSKEQAATLLRKSAGLNEADESNEAAVDAITVSNPAADRLWLFAKASKSCCW